MSNEKAESPASVQMCSGASVDAVIIEKIEHSAEASQDLTPLIRRVLELAVTGPVEQFIKALNEVILASYMRGRIEGSRMKSDALYTEFRRGFTDGQKFERENGIV